MNKKIIIGSVRGLARVELSKAVGRALRQNRGPKLAPFIEKPRRQKRVRREGGQLEFWPR